MVFEVRVHEIPLKGLKSIYIAKKEDNYPTQISIHIAIHTDIHTYC